jgi:hypothetical protein
MTTSSSVLIAARRTTKNGGKLFRRPWPLNGLGGGMGPHLERRLKALVQCRRRPPRLKPATANRAAEPRGAVAMGRRALP